MRYEEVWRKTLNPDEKIEYEFSIGDAYVKKSLIYGIILSLLLLPLYGLGVLVFFWVLFYFGFYIKRANAYAFTNKRVVVHKGWLSTHTISVDYDKITDVSVKEPFLDRIMFKTGSLVINTAGTHLKEVILNHIESPYETKKKLDQLRST